VQAIVSEVFTEKRSPAGVERGAGRSVAARRAQVVIESVAVAKKDLNRWDWSLYLPIELGHLKMALEAAGSGDALR